jgi:NADH-quinone oxidoreductase subunit C
MADSDQMVDAVAAAIGEGLLGVDTDRAGTPVMVVDRAALLQTCLLLRDGDEKFAHLSSVWGMDYQAMGLEPRFAVVYYLYSPSSKRRIALKVPLEESDLVAPSVVEIWPGANFHEREAFDMYGIRFDGHPNLTRILLPDDADFFPLRKDFPIGEEPVQFTHNLKPSGDAQRNGHSEASRN